MQAIYAEAKLARQAGWFSRRHSSPGCREELGSTRERQCGVCIDHDDHGYDPDAARALRADLDAFHGGE